MYGLRRGDSAAFLVRTPIGLAANDVFRRRGDALALASVPPA